MSAEGSGGSHELRSFGRRRGRRMSPRQAQLLEEVLPRVSLDMSGPPPSSSTELRALFSSARTPVSDVWLEIGFGGGEHLIWQAEANPEVGLIGCEPFLDGVVKVVSAIAERGLGNILLHPDDARPLLRRLPAASLGRVFILFPDPWPKARHHKRRLVSTATLDLLAPVMRPGAELRIATDIGDHARTILAAVCAHSAFDWNVRGPDDWRLRKPDWPRTRYEEKALREGRCGYFFTFVRNTSDA